MPNRERKRVRVQRAPSSRSRQPANAAKSEEQDNLLKKLDAKSLAALQKGSTDPSDILRMQHAMGNQAVMRLLGQTTATAQKPAIQAKRGAPAAAEEQPVDQMHTPNMKRQTEPALEHIAEIAPAVMQRAAVTPMTIQRGFFSRGRGNTSKGPMGETAQVGGASVTGYSVYAAVKRGLELLKGVKDAGGALIGGALTEISNLLQGLSIPGFVGLVKRILDTITSYQEMKSLETAKKTLDAKKAAGSLSASEEHLHEATSHGYAKVRRRFWKAVYMVVSSIVKITSHFITLLSGGTTAMVTEVVALGATVLEGIKVLYEKGKGFIKWLLNKRGAHRKQSADRILASAKAGDETALQLLVDMDPIGILGRQKRALKYGYGDPPKPSNTAEMKALIKMFETKPDRYGDMTEFHEDIQKRLKST